MPRVRLANGTGTSWTHHAQIRLPFGELLCMYRSAITINFELQRCIRYTTATKSDRQDNDGGNNLVIVESVEIKTEEYPWLTRSMTPSATLETN